MSIGRVGGEWVNDYSAVGEPSLKNTDVRVLRFLSEIDGVIQFNYGDGNAWDEDFEKMDKPPGSAGIAFAVVEKCDLVYFAGHGSISGLSFGRNDRDDGIASPAEVSWGEDKLKWIVLDACDILVGHDSGFIPPIDAALYSKTDTIFFFVDQAYISYTYGLGLDPGFPKRISDGWENWPTRFKKNIDAAVYKGDGKAYFFKGGEYLRHTLGVGMDSGYPKQIAGHWKNWPVRFENGIDAAVYNGDGKAYFLKGGEYLRHTFGSGMDSGYPKPIAGHWKNWPGSFTGGVDAAAYLGDGKAYFFKGLHYLKHTFGQGMASGYPKLIEDNWIGVPESKHFAVTRWDSAFNGLHYIFGFNSVSRDVKDRGRIFAQYLNDGFKFRVAWKKACQETESSDIRWAYIRAVQEGTDTENDHWINKGYVSNPPDAPTSFVFRDGSC